nr:low-density lipoprotein receptor-related protein 4-like isoform X1 [Rhipicephalus microplus]
MNFQCKDKTCVMASAKCDGIRDCPEGEDEHNCDIVNSTCSDLEVMCPDSSACIKPLSLCDGIYNCRDRSDESGCVDKTLCEQSNKFYCGDKLCIPSALRCDGHEDCKDGEDEVNCTCGENQFQCMNGFCVSSATGSVRCNGVADCIDGSDERGCVQVDNNGLAQGVRRRPGFVDAHVRGQRDARSRQPTLPGDGIQRCPFDTNGESGGQCHHVGLVERARRRSRHHVVQGTHLCGLVPSRCARRQVRLFRVRESDGSAVPHRARGDGAVDAERRLALPGSPARKRLVDRLPRRDREPALGPHHRLLSPAASAERFAAVRAGGIHAPRQRPQAPQRGARGAAPALLAVPLQDAARLRPGPGEARRTAVVRQPRRVGRLPARRRGPAGRHLLRRKPGRRKAQSSVQDGLVDHSPADRHKRADHSATTRNTTRTASPRR